LSLNNCMTKVLSPAQKADCCRKYREMASMCE
jgi:hypothetical protein